ncbi:MAG: NUDIX hydrolase [Ideonella sp.]|nr:NUDIX hydrolase [Ideonella sp.]
MSDDLRFRPSVTVAAVIARPMAGDEQYLLVEEETVEGLRLNNPAGHLEQGESPLEGVVREVLEETACDFTPVALLGVYLSRFQRTARGGRAAEDVTYVRVAYTGSVGEPAVGRRLDAGIVRTLWLGYDELLATRDRHRSPLVLRCIDDHRAGRRLPLDIVQADGSVRTPEIRD